MDKKEFKEGDLVTIKLTDYQAAFLNDTNVSWDIIKHEPAPFDWKDAEQGMAFKDKAGVSVYYFVAFDIVDSSCVILAENCAWSQFFSENMNELTRAPEHDMEVGDEN